MQQIQDLLQVLDEKCKDNDGPWTRLKQMLETLLRFPAEVIEEVIELNGAEERAFVAEVQQDAERLRQQAAAQQQTNEAT